MARDPIDLSDPSYTPARLISEAQRVLKVRNHARLAQVLEISHAQLSRIYHRIEPISDRTMVAIMDRTDWHVRHVRELAGMPYDGGAMPDLLVRRAA